jgi:multidrug resistance efflux pump
VRTRALRRRTSLAAATLLLAGLPLSGCSDDDTASYCDALTSAQAEWNDAGATLKDPAAAARLVASVRRVEASAPAEVKGDWTSLRSLFEKFTVPRTDLAALTRQMRSYETSAKRVEAHARETCGVDLGR